MELEEEEEGRLWRTEEVVVVGEGQEGTLGRLVFPAAAAEEEEEFDSEAREEEEAGPRGGRREEMSGEEA